VGGKGEGEGKRESGLCGLPPNENPAYAAA